jgi:hypothetical protein
MNTRQEVIELKRKLSEVERKFKEEERHREQEEARNHIYPEAFPFVVDDVDEVTGGWFVHGPCDDEGNNIWSDEDEAERRWLAYPKLVEKLKGVILKQKLDGIRNLLEDLGELKEND